MKRIYLLLSLLLCQLLCMSQVSTSQNYISARTYTSADRSGCREQVIYYDGLGRPSQTVDRSITPDKKDIVSLQEYDDQGRKLRTWLPAKSTGNGMLYECLLHEERRKLVGQAVIHVPYVQHNLRSLSSESDRLQNMEQARHGQNTL